VFVLIFEVPTVALLQIRVFWVVMLCHWVIVVMYFRGMYCLQNVRKN